VGKGGGRRELKKKKKRQKGAGTNDGLFHVRKRSEGHSGDGKIGLGPMVNRDQGGGKRERKWGDGVTSLSHDMGTLPMERLGKRGLGKKNQDSIRNAQWGGGR